MEDSTLERLEALEKRVERLEFELALARLVPVVPALKGADSGKAPTRILIARWISNRQDKRLGPEAKLSRHASTFADLFSRCSGDVELAIDVIDRYFKDHRTYVLERGWSIACLASMMDGLVVDAQRAKQRASVIVPQTVAPRHEAAPALSSDELGEMIAKLKKKGRG